MQQFGMKKNQSDCAKQICVNIFAGNYTLCHNFVSLYFLLFLIIELYPLVNLSKLFFFLLMRGVFKKERDLMVKKN